MMTKGRRFFTDEFKQEAVALASGDQAAEIARLKRELERVRMEQDILKKLS